MTWQLLSALLAATLVAIACWLAGHYVNVRRDRRNRRREIRLEYLIENVIGVRHPQYALKYFRSVSATA
jgi:protein-tyrosine phosphatase